jgi:hypothetical protein
VSAYDQMLYVFLTADNISRLRNGALISVELSDRAWVTAASDRARMPDLLITDDTLDAIEKEPLFGEVCTLPGASRVPVRVGAC